MKTAIQSLGAKKTYLRRYLWIDAMEIAENDIVDAQPTDDAKETKPTAKVTKAKKPDNVAPEEMAVEFTKLRTELSKIGVDIREEKTEQFIKDKAKVTTVEPGALLGDVESMSRVLVVLNGILKAKQS